MRTVVLMGAGSSLAHAIDARPSRRSEHPPLDADFFPRVADLSRRNEDVELRMAALESAIRRSRMFPDPWTKPYPSMEQFFADVYYEVAGDSAAAFRVFVELLHLYAVVLGVTTNWMACKSRSGLLGRLLRREIQMCDGDPLTIITFNQDLLIENELATFPAKMGLLTLHDLYGGIPLSPLYGRSMSQNELFEHQAAIEGVAALPVTLLKLHGSMNWMLRTTKRNPQVGTLFPRQNNASRSVFLLNRRLIQDQLMMRTTTAGGTGRSRWYLWPLVVPPIYDKQRITAMDLLKSVWDMAAQSLDEADRVVLVGYSLPEADILARQMLRRAFLGNAALDSVDCVNPDISLALKLKQMLGPKVIRSFHDVESYLTETERFTAGSGR